MAAMRQGRVGAGAPTAAAVVSHFPSPPSHVWSSVLVRLRVRSSHIRIASMALALVIIVICVLFSAALQTLVSFLPLLLLVAAFVYLFQNVFH